MDAGVDETRAMRAGSEVHNCTQERLAIGDERKPLDLGRGWSPSAGLPGTHIVHHG
jgi:hypothetical protein